MTIEQLIYYLWMWLFGFGVGMNLVVHWNRYIVLKKGGHCACACTKGCC